MAWIVAALETKPEGKASQWQTVLGAEPAHAHGAPAALMPMTARISVVNARGLSAPKGPMKRLVRRREWQGDQCDGCKQ